MATDRPIKKLDVRGPEDIAKLPEKKPELETVNVPDPPKPDLSTSFWEELTALLRFIFQKKVRDASEGKDVSFDIIGAGKILSSPWLWVGLAVLLIGLGLLRIC